MKSRISSRKKEKKKKCANFSAFCKYFLIFKGGDFFFTSVGIILIEYFDDYVVGYCDWICDAYCWWWCYFISFFFITFLDTHCIHTQNDHELQEIIIVVSIVVGCEVSKIMMTLNERKRIF